ncbi:MAG: DUF1028 domain-containing protein [Candidatus Marinimicrobia bacterium]|jgi:uncharacterized Ntn-hydrolase superfamily protein|nr:DUF1028 domain-containing protein [Candidatus Neomarinimicrobiota bacterium]MBT3847876.1 DUF1028 domain-containing protein [Candidatus Neomarinimicrobiota bacterium]MBT4054901.1 DUF1028 domain-containing protein [Candidatus Neomarinimicrobiota bacterium]MBT4369569.1 DUF1028 domain-containing protein [Candidatus Neomarinimicrobiota bacterium]MBT4660330.1 DUF1028 domain-containing protein [Candidatus Neomarinimicrobiota bacterium]
MLSTAKNFQNFLLTPGIFLGVLFSQPISESIPVHTYSIVALDEKTGELGVAVQSHWFSVGSLVPWAKAGVGAVATQSFVKVDYGPDGLKLMEGGMSAESALNKLVMEDKGEAVRQVAMIDMKGNVATHTGEKCIYAAGHQIGKNYSVQANLMENETVWPAMAKAFENTEGDLADKMMAALYAAEGEGGDIRGKQSAAMLIVTGEPTGVPWKDVVMDIRVDDHAEPLKELKRLIRVHRAYQHANKGDYYLEFSEIDKALSEYEMAAKYYPENPELPYWSAITLAGKGQLEKALPIFKDVFKREPRLRKLTPRLVNAGLLPDDPELIETIMKVDE